METVAWGCWEPGRRPARPAARTVGPVEVVAAVSQSPSGPPPKSLSDDSVESIRVRFILTTLRASQVARPKSECQRRRAHGRSAKRNAASDSPPRRCSLVQSVTAPTEADDTCAAYLASTPRV